mmetsp:Transcript_21528/g.53050  ORF Transcript_21528/g.53050 Transcript_21528/m.53050 type:complete len:213 (-) Transcript_21528:314-952(-)
MMLLQLRVVLRVGIQRDASSLAQILGLFSARVREDPAVLHNQLRFHVVILSSFRVRLGRQRPGLQMNLAVDPSKVASFFQNGSDLVEALELIAKRVVDFLPRQSALRKLREVALLELGQNNANNIQQLLQLLRTLELCFLRSLAHVAIHEHDKAGMRHGHLHLLFRCPITVPSDRDHAPKLLILLRQPEAPRTSQRFVEGACLVLEIHEVGR